MKASTLRLLNIGLAIVHISRTACFPKSPREKNLISLVNHSIQDRTVGIGDL